MILADTSVWVDFFGPKRTKADRWLASRLAEEGDVCICGIILTEIRQGLRSEAQVREIMRSLDPLPYLLIAREGYILAADIYRAARARGKTIRNTTDCIIAACAITNNVPLAQHDRDFAIIAQTSDLQLVEL